MEDLRETYIKLCRGNHVSPQENVLNEISGMTGTSLHLSALALSSETCFVLGKWFAVDHNITDLLFCDSMLPEDGLQAILHGLCTNTTVKHLDLKGNNIRGSGAETLGKLLRHNHTLQILGLEWNALGLLPGKFSLFAEGLSNNLSIKVLDLRNNQITHQGAKDLAEALKKNGRLESLDLRWNNIGLLGGRMLLESLVYNKILCTLELAGNNVSVETVKAIGNAVISNAERKLIKNEQVSQQRRLTEEIRSLEHGKMLQVSSLMEKLEKKDEELVQSERVNSTRITQLKESLAERSMAFESLSSKLRQVILDVGVFFALVSHSKPEYMVERRTPSCLKLERFQISLSIAETKNKDLSLLLERTQEDNSNLRQQHHSILSKEKKERAKKEAELIQETGNLKQDISHLQQMVESLKIEKKEQENQSQELKNKIEGLEKHTKIMEKNYQDHIDSIKERHKEALQIAEDQKLKAISRIQVDATEMEKELRNRIMNINTQYLHCEEEISRLNSQLVLEKSRCEKMLLEQCEKLKADEAQKCGQLEDKLKLLQEAKDNQQVHLSNQSQTMRQIQARNTALALEVEELKHKIDQLQQLLSRKEEEMTIQLTKVQLEVKDQLEELEEKRQTTKIIKEKLMQTTKNFDDCKRQNEDKLLYKDREISTLKELIKSKENQIKHLHEEEIQRAAVLQSAVTAYVDSIKQKYKKFSSLPLQDS